MLTPGRTLAVAVHRPLAEQLVDLAALRGGERVLELFAGDGELTRRLRDHGAAVEAVDISEQPSGLLLFPSASFDVALSLLALDAGDNLASALAELARVAQRARVVVWEDGATHETALHQAWDAAGGAAPSPVRGAVAPVELPPGWSRTTLADVARFDSVGLLLAALTSERGIEVADGRRDDLREHLALALTPFIAADGTLRMPVHASLLALG